MADGHNGNAAAKYAARVDAVLAQRARLRGPQPPGDLFAGLRADHPLIKANPRRALDPNVGVIASYVERDDVIIDAGGGAGRISLPLALRSRAVVNVEPSAAMGAGFKANAVQAGITNASLVEGDWLAVDAPAGTFALANHVAYLTRDIVPFVEKLQRAGSRRVLMTVNDPPPPSWNRVLFELLYGEPEESEPGHVELTNVLWELGILPDIRVLPLCAARPIVAAPTRAAAIEGAIAAFGPAWSFWPLGTDVEARLRGILEERFAELFAANDDGVVPRWIAAGREVLITWRPAVDRRVS
ncbi:MAG TPA: hypothetical protein VND95_06720 [Stellaceae bacterium]|nr:hypothetical protein [Stellaceae bacterium]